MIRKTRRAATLIHVIETTNAHASLGVSLAAFVFRGFLLNVADWRENPKALGSFFYCKVILAR